MRSFLLTTTAIDMLAQRALQLASTNLSECTLERPSIFAYAAPYGKLG